MECNKDEAVRAKNTAENKMRNNDFEGGRKFALKAQKLFPELENMSQMLAVCDVHCAANRKVNDAAKDLYGILQVETLADVATIKKQYRKLELVLHPDKNHFPGAESAFKLIGEANTILSDNRTRSLYDYTCIDPEKSTFWTCCPICKIKYEFYRDIVNKVIWCPICLKTFIAIDIGKSTQATYAGMRNVNPRTNMCPPTSSQQEEVGKQENAKSGGTTIENADIIMKGGEKGVANKGAGGSPSCTSDSNGRKAECSKQSRKRAHVSNSEEAVVNFRPEKRYAMSKSSGDVKDKQKDVPADAELYVNFPDVEFSNFDKDKEAHCFAVDQIWALYDTFDCMPRFYAQIRKVYSSGFRLRITWLDADPEDPLEKNWVEEGLPVACGKFKRGDSKKAKDRLMFSHQMAFEKGSKSVSFFIYPKKGEIWALFKDWDIAKWCSDPGNHKKYEFEIVEIMSDFGMDNGVLVAYMVKVEGFVSRFKKTSRAKLADHWVPSSDLFRFSHRIPSLKLTGNERADVPVGSWELDTASLPDISSAQMSAFPEPLEKKVRSKGYSDQSTGVQNTSKIAMPAKGNDPSRHDDVVNISSTEFTKSHPVSSPFDDKEPKISIHNFSLDKQKWIFKAGQIWALGRSKNAIIRCYAQIKKIESSPLRLHVNLLELCSDTDTVRPYACGDYKASTVGRQIFQRDLFFYLASACLIGRNYFNIYPGKNQIWILCKERDAEYTFADVDAGNCDIVEVVENIGDVTKVLLLTHVGGYRSVFKRVDRVVEITIDESNRFFCPVPAVLLTNEQDGRLRGFWELDLADFPGLVPI